MSSLAKKFKFLTLRTRVGFARLLRRVNLKVNLEEKFPTCSPAISGLPRYPTVVSQC
jgi:hypothetical protein